MANPLLQQTAPLPSSEDLSLYQNAIHYLADTLKTLSLQLNGLLEQAKDHNSLGIMLTIIGLSFFYGVIHASGPGHGKMLVASYFSANDKSYKKALFISFAIAVVHTFSALFITLIAYFLLSSVFLVSLNDNTQIATKVSGAIIIFIGCYLLYNKYKHHLSQRKAPQWSTAPQAPSCSCASCKSTHSTDLALVLSAGLIPCPGTITIFLFSISLGLFMIGFASAVAMSLGMGLIIALLSLLSVKFRNSAKSRFSKFLKILELVSVFVILLLGLVLILS